MDPNVSIDERARAFKFCSTHLDGAWKNVNPNTVMIYRINGGMSNLLYYCALPDNVTPFGKEPRQVLLRLYGPAHGDTEVQLEIFNQLAAERLGPRLYGMFDEGRFEEYLPSDPLSWIELTSDHVSEVVARKIASIHKLNVKCLERKSTWLIEKYNHYNSQIAAMSNNNSTLPSFTDDTLDSTKTIAQKLIGIDFNSEIRYLAELFQDSQAPLVFSHNDLHQNNIILLHNDDLDNDPQANLDDRIVLIDFEYSSYNYRTFDLANHLSEWCFDYNSDKYPFFRASLDLFPSDEKQKQFLGHYVNQAIDADGYDNGSLLGSSLKVNDRASIVEILFNEMQPFLMASNLLWTIWAIYSAYTSKIKFGYWEMAQYKWDIYRLCKERFRSRTPVKYGCDSGDKFVQSPKIDPMLGC